ncbi:MAG TPA: MgtC/SapB family protein [Myxococcota bacterium]|nr:MgtC/SapB family protein [Myxococcota bacterium]
MDESFHLDIALRLGAALGLGLLMGLEREFAQRNEEASFGGVRTFALISLSGAAATYAGVVLEQPLVTLAGFAGIAALIVVSYVTSSRQGHLGLTTEVSALLTFVLGALCVHGHVSVAAAIGVVAVLLLALKNALHTLASRIESADVEATLRFALITAIVLPLLPDQTYGPPPFDVLNPYEIWLMVVLIAGLNFAGYVLVKLMGAEHGFGLTGLLGGLVSSTALSLGFAQRSKQEPGQSRALALGILLAWTVMFVRVIAEVAVVNPALVRRMAPTAGALAVAGLAATFYLHRTRARARGRAATATAPSKNPLELRMAIQFGLLYAAITLGARAAQHFFGEAGLYAAGALAGVSDVDAITLSMANLAASSPDSASAAARTIEIAVLSNTAAKCAMVCALGAPELRRTLLPIGALLGVVGLASMLVAL